MYYFSQLLYYCQNFRVVLDPYTKMNTTKEDFDINSIDISNIDIEILKQAYIDLRLVTTKTMDGDPLSDFPMINEDDDITPPDNDVNSITQK